MRLMYEWTGAEIAGAGSPGEAERGCGWSGQVLASGEIATRNLNGEMR